MTFTNKIAQKWFVLLLLAVVAILALSGCEPGVDEEEVPATVTVTGLDVGVETTVEVVATPGGPQELGVDQTVPAQDPLLPVTGIPTIAAAEEPLAEATQTPPARVETPPAFVEAVTDEMRSVVRLSDLTGQVAVTGTGETVGQVTGILIDSQSTLPYILLDIRALTGTESRVVPVEGYLFEATFEGEESVVFYLGSIPYLESLSPLDVTQGPEDSIALRSVDVGLAAESESLIWIRDRATLSGLELVNAQGEALGEIRDLIINWSTGEVLYAVVDTGSFLGVGENTVAIPWRQAQFDETEQQLVLEVEAETLESAPPLDLTQWESPADPDWDADIRDYWQEMN